MATPYHRLARETPAYAWWKLPVAGLVILGFYLVLSTVLVAGAAVYFAASSGDATFTDWLDAAGDLDLAHLDFFVIDMLSLVVLIPAVLLGVLAIGPRPIGYLSSVAGRLRWGWLGRTALISFAIFTVTIGASLVVSEMTDPAEVSAPTDIGRRAVVAIVVVLLIVPFQAAAEEYVFRGYLMQLVGSWSRFAIIPVVVTTPLFVAGHLYDVWGLLDVGIFGLTAAILTIRTGGLEAGIAAHTANNVLLFVLDALGMVSATDDSGAGPVDLLPTVVSSVLLLVVVEWAARRHGILRTRAPLPEPPPPPVPLAPMWPPPPYAMVWHVPPVWPPPPPTGWVAGPAPVTTPAPRQLHPDTPDYPGDLPPGWNSSDRA
ncbi:MAG: type II CAAX endopeptidase family protein [Aeromicrobium sp.]